MRRALAASAFGMVRVRTPFSKLAFAASAFTSVGKAKERSKDSIDRSRKW